MMDQKEKQRTALLFLHGFPLHPAMWDRQREAFEAEYEVVTPDLRLEGERRGDELPQAVTMEHMADAAAAALDAAGAARAVVIGFSMGGYVAFTLLEKYPDRVAGLVLADTRAEADSEEGKAGRRKLAEAVLAKGSQAAADAMLGKLLSPKTAEARPDTVQAVERMILEASPQAIASAALGMALRADRTGGLGSIRVPTLVVVGEDDAITPPDVARKLADAIPAAALAIIPGGGHLANVEQPEAFNKALSSWLSGHGL
jgi:3-oxoadipate enol-lactonase